METKYKYNYGNYPLTMQAYFDQYDELMFNELFNAYKNKFNLDKTFNYQFNKNDKFYVNFSSFVILNDQNKIVDFAFEEIDDFFWILKLINIDGLEFKLNKNIIEKSAEALDFYLSKKIIEKL